MYNCVFICIYIYLHILINDVLHPTVVGYPLDWHDMMTSSNGSFFRITGPVTGEFPSQRASYADFDVSLMWVHISQSKTMSENEYPLSAILTGYRVNNAGTRSASCLSWWRHQIKTFSALLALCEGNPPTTGGLPSQGPVTRSFDFFSLIWTWTNG